MDTNMLLRQHKEIREVVNFIRELLHKGFMYPSLLNYSSVEMQNMAKQYMDQMGSIYEDFESYKIRNNTKTKILSDVEGFVAETVKILDIIENRMTREDRKLYPLIPNYMQNPLGIA